MRSSISRVLLLSVALLCALAAAVPAVAQQSAGGASLYYPAGIRADGMGRAFVSIADDPSALWWNPAGLAWQRYPVELGPNAHNAAMTNYSRLVPDLADDVFHLNLTYLHHSQSWGTFGGSLAYLSYGRNTITTGGTDGGSGESLGTFTSYELAPSLAFGTALSPSFAVGFGVKLLYVNLAPTFALQSVGISTGTDIKGTGTSVAVDFGALARTSMKISGRDLELGAGA